MIIIGICGRSGSGKTTLTDFFAQSGYTVINADRVSREVTKAGTPCADELKIFFGGRIINSDGILDRKLLFDKAMKNPKNRAVLNKITHKYILAEIDKRIQNSESNLIFIDAPLLFESGLDKKCHFTVCVIADDDDCTERILKRDGISLSDSRIRLSAQINNDELSKKCDFTIKNSKSVEELFCKAKALLDEIKNRQKSF
ncbi:MAG: dephospho-CoA kinase [Clostridia bacterium]